MKPRPLAAVVLCVRPLTGKRAVVAHFHGHPVTILRDHGPCIAMAAAVPSERTRRALRSKLCDLHGCPIVEACELPAGVSAAASAGRA